MKRPSAEDARVVAENELRIEVVTKAGRGQPWRM